MRVALFVLIYFTHSLAFGQHASLVVQGPEQPEMKLFLNGAPWNATSASRIQIDSIGLGVQTVDIQIEDSLKTLLRTSIFTYPNITYVLSLNTEEDSLSLTQHEISTQYSDETNKNLTETVVTDAREMEINVFQPSENQCAIPLTPNDITEVKEQVKLVYFEKEKTQIIEDLLASSCYTVSQINELISLVDNEERRLGLIKITYPNCFNRSEFTSLKSLFLLERYQKEFNSWINSLK
jgi:hypothetical protein